jgi:hypothetical protein
VALLWCAAPVLAAVHAGVEAHRYCAEHGTVEEAGEAVVGSPEATPVVAGEGEEQAPHDGCDFARFCRFGQVLAQLILDVAGTPDVALAPSPSPAQAAPAVAVIVIAPKTSPPV